MTHETMSNIKQSAKNIKYLIWGIAILIVLADVVLILAK